MRGLDRLALAPSSEAREDASRGDPQPAETCRRPLAPAPPCSCRIADPPPTLQRGSDRPVLALSSSAPPPKSCSVSLPSLARMRTALSVPRTHCVFCGLQPISVDLELVGLFATDCGRYSARRFITHAYPQPFRTRIATYGLYLVRMRRNRPGWQCCGYCLYWSSSGGPSSHGEPSSS